ncbi:hypothetical protein E2C01_096961 [Portunus trituberculatus]|uniref:Uncharacterized protein n=1 Tax=Portunus trituberculatus TaxID=210409 RepID=A0A5B7K495_PORTR|nr:hypothetical protein [Portunus trituberculatus]
MMASFRSSRLMLTPSTGRVSYSTADLNL